MKIIRVLAFLALGLAMLGAAGFWLLSVLPRARPRTPLAVAAASGSPEELRREMAIHPDLRGGEGLGALIWASRSGRADSIAELVRAGVDPNQQDSGPNGWPPLIHAVHKNQLGSVRALLSAGAEPDLANPDGLTPLMLAAAQGEGEIVEELLASGADPRLRQPGGETALTYAATEADARCVKALLARAPDLRLGNTWKDWLAPRLARLRGRREVLALLENPGLARNPAKTANAGREER
ncbi:MAG TPA: ankyrin repeat domain-containing protein [Thermoanaerobaculia bacterium]|nr:ankyrin repeat domain-containing protein [Thermoanaerobaculia bacterium]